MNEEDPSTEQALALWQSTAKYYKTSYLAWSKYSELLMYVSFAQGYYLLILR